MRRFCLLSSAHPLTIHRSTPHRPYNATLLKITITPHVTAVVWSTNSEWDRDQAVSSSLLALPRQQSDHDQALCSQPTRYPLRQSQHLCTDRRSSLMAATSSLTEAVHTKAWNLGGLHEVGDGILAYLSPG
jgi:hypothetical protein